jgi:uncharacterized OsmC-like protein
MITSKITYSGELRTKAIHVRSSQEVITDAPIDNQGKGEAFSPTDIVCSALCSCMMTIMGQVAQREAIPMEGITAEVTKLMSASPRKISEVVVNFDMRQLSLSDKQRKMLENAARTCPVALSLSDEVIQTVTFDY